MDILVIAQYPGDLRHPEGNNSRFLYLAGLLREQGHRVELVTSSFFHEEKGQYGSLPGEIFGCKLTCIHEPGYPKNICLRRFFSHDLLAQGVGRYLKNREKPDLIYAAVPSLSLGKKVAGYCEKQHIPLVIDVQDLWPEAFEMVFRVPVLSNILYAPLKAQANYIYRRADGVAAVSETYAQRALSVNQKGAKSAVAYLGTELKAFDGMVEETPYIPKPQGEIWLGYVGTLGKSYAVQDVLEAMALLKEEGKCPRLRLVVMGDGQQKPGLEAFAKERNLQVTFTGMLPYPQMVSTLHRCDFAVNPIRRGAASIINKVGDYAAAGLAVLNTQVCAEYEGLLEAYKAGITCENGSVPALARAIETLYSDEPLRLGMGQGNRRMAEERFDRGASYRALQALIETTEQRGGR